MTQTTTTTTTGALGKLLAARDALLAKIQDDPRAKLAALDRQIQATEAEAAEAAARAADQARIERVLQLRESEEAAFALIVKAAQDFEALTAQLRAVHARLAADREMPHLADFGLGAAVHQALAAWPMVPAGRRALGIAEPPTREELAVEEARADVARIKDNLARARELRDYNYRVESVARCEADVARAEARLKAAEEVLRDSRRIAAKE